MISRRTKGKMEELHNCTVKLKNLDYFHERIMLAFLAGMDFGEKIKQNEETKTSKDKSTQISSV